MKAKPLWDSSPQPREMPSRTGVETDKKMGFPDDREALQNIDFIGRGERIRTFDPLLPKQQNGTESIELSHQLLTSGTQNRE